jgi:hypothetical protein
MPKTKNMSRKPSSTKVAAVNRAQGKSTTHKYRALPLADARSSEASAMSRMMAHLQHRHSAKCDRRQDISVAELPNSRRATAQSERMVRDPQVAVYFHTMNANNCNTASTEQDVSTNSRQIHSRCSG